MGLGRRGALWGDPREEGDIVGGPQGGRGTTQVSQGGLKGPERTLRDELGDDEARWRDNGALGVWGVPAGGRYSPLKDEGGIGLAGTGIVDVDGVTGVGS